MGESGERAGAASAAHLRCADPATAETAGGFEITLKGDEVTIGRGRDNTVQLACSRVSRHHARLLRVDDNWQVEDRGSTNGTHVNGKRVRRRILTEGDAIAFGRLGFTFHAAERRSNAVAESGVSTPDTTVITGPGGAATAGGLLNPVDAAAASSRPGAEQFYDTGTHRRYRGKQPQPAASSLGTWILMLALCALTSAVGAWLLGLF